MYFEQIADKPMSKNSECEFASVGLAKRPAMIKSAAQRTLVAFSRLVDVGVIKAEAFTEAARTEVRVVTAAFMRKVPY